MAAVRKSLGLGLLRAMLILALVVYVVAEATNTSTTTTTTSAQAISMTMAMTGVDYSDLIASPESKAQCEDALKRAIAGGSSSLVEDDVSLILAPGSIIPVQALIFSPSTSFDTVLSDLKAGQTDIALAATGSLFFLTAVGSTYVSVQVTDVRDVPANEVIYWAINIGGVDYGSLKANLTLMAQCEEGLKRAIAGGSSDLSEDDVSLALSRPSAGSTIAQVLVCPPSTLFDAVLSEQQEKQVAITAAIGLELLFLSGLTGGAYVAVQALVLAALPGEEATSTTIVTTTTQPTTSTSLATTATRTARTMTTIVIIGVASVLVAATIVACVCCWWCRRSRQGGVGAAQVAPGGTVDMNAVLPETVSGPFVTRTSSEMTRNSSRSQSLSAAAPYYVLVSAPAKSTLTGGEPYDQDVFSYALEVALNREDFEVGYDQAGSSSADARDFEPGEESEVMRSKGKIGQAKRGKGIKWDDCKSVERSYWFVGYKERIKAIGISKIQTKACLVVFLCIEGGPITQLEQQHIGGIVKDAKDDAEMKQYRGRLSIRKMDYISFVEEFKPVTVVQEFS